MSLVTEQSRMFVGGAWVGAGGGETMTVRNPATGEALAELPDAGREDVWRAVDAAAAAFPAWAATPAIERGRILHRVFDLMTEHRDDLARLVTQENGKPFEEARREVAFATGYFSWFAEEARRVYGEIVPPPVAGKRLWVLKQPLGVVAAITPWNFPATMVTRKIAPALAAGCTVVLKPASATPLTALALARLCQEAGLPAGVFNVVTGTRSGVIGQAFLDHPAVRKVAFTGSTEVGKRLMAGASAHLKRVAFELGGNAPFIVFDDADLAAAAEGAVAIKFLRVAGQSCICANRVYVHERVADRFVPLFIEKVKGLKVAPGFAPGAQIGPLINREILDKVDGLVQAAVADGARVVAGGRRLTDGELARGLFYAPTVLVDVREEMDVAREEIFGPVAPVMTFGDEPEVIARANATTFGLAAYFYTRDLRRAIRVAEALEYGMVGINDPTGYTHEIPFGGFKESGLGREGGHQGLEEYMEVKAISIGM
ncbi:MAG: NAD-dependent succinate-semialdehyde dehydrogenase [Armatimonadota bacterium]|nr:NAD-dependent succinate-semialdehyde dehydrogenase [Armatimonadota bacterium]MDR7486046.1 NAD-dependent succinate-semialdehyde dehydrogenase [Armatimonadota bacterium]MDR7532617.1 NAD-dependent succinate-semialdehyde dehydrogenase [Armatimonadota bacterium]MDR7536174.1 NAD-dependent succinate-semialdehyde dehydrogenase [Armatimonadota bacterium]